MLTSGWRKPLRYVRFDPLKNAGPSGLAVEGNLNAANDDTTNQGVVEQRMDGQSEILQQGGNVTYR